MNVTVAVLAVRKENDEECNLTYWLSLDHHPKFDAEHCTSVRWVCTQALEQSVQVGILIWTMDMPWQELKQYLNVYFPGYGWAEWAEPEERV